MKNKAGIYKIINKANGKVYYGSSENIGMRWTRHKSDLNNNNHGNHHLQKAWNKYGEKWFNIEIEFQMEMDCDLIEIEQLYLDLYFDKGLCCYNENPIAGKPPSWKNKKHSDETKLIMSISQNGHKVSEITKNKMSVARKGVKKGPFTEEHKRNLSISNKGKKRSDEFGKKMSIIKVGKPAHNRRVGKEQVIKIRELLKNGMTQEYVAKIFGISRSIVGRIGQNKTYKDIA